MTDARDLHEIAALFSVSDTAVRSWVAAGLPVLEQGKQGGGRKRTRISLEAAVAWYFRTNHEALELTRARTQMARESATRMQYENAVSANTLADVRMTARILADAAGVIVKRLNQIPGAVAQQFDVPTAARVQKIVREAITVAVGDLHDRFERGARKGSRRKSNGGASAS